MKTENREIEEVEKHFHFFLEELPYKDVLDLFLMFLGERPSSLIMNAESQEIQKLENFCGRFEIHYRIEAGKSAISQNAVFVTEEKARLENLEKVDGRFCGFTDEQVAEFLDYPEEDSEYFSENISSGQIEPEVRSKTREMIAENKLEQDALKYIELVGYVPKPEKDNIQEAVEKGKQYESAIRAFDEENNSDLGAELMSLALKDSY
jgi:hypothetical protein